mmetsp:Transcript_22472/g.32802  ORF Transcript_22472/g.32802 Transcript_22472/m.32802 type:complete len:387 (-) Transcript_22472:38-1198(-)
MKQYTGFSLGIFFIVIVAVIWAGASVLTQYIYSDLDFKSPFLVTYIATALFSLYLPLWRVWVWMGVVEDPPWRLEHLDSSHSSTDNLLEKESIISSRPGSRESNGVYQRVVDDDETLPTADLDRDNKLIQVSRAEEYCHVDVIKISLLVAPLWFIANFFYNYSLLLTSVGSSTIISNLSGSFTLLFSYLLGLEEITYGKLIGLGLSLSGVALIGVQDHDNGEKHTVTGDLVALVAAAAYGLYTATIKIKIPEDDGVSMQLLFGYIGAVTAVLLSPVIFFLGVFNLGNIYDLTGKIFGFLLLGSIFNNVISDYLWARSVVLTSPTIATVGLSITIPLALTSDFIFFSKVPTYMSVSGALLVILGFVSMSAEVSIRKYMIECFKIIRS